MAFNAYEFVFDGISCKQYDLMIYDFDNLKQNDNAFGTQVTISEDRLNDRYSSLHYGTSNNKVLEFPLVFGANTNRILEEKPLDRWEMQAIASWLTGHKQYKWLEIVQPDLFNVRYKCIITSLKPITVGWLPWAFTATIKCDSPYAYRTPTTFKFKVDGSSAGVILNRGSHNGYYYPNIKLSLPHGGDFSIRNKSDKNREFSITGNPITKGCEIEIDNQNQTITNNLDINLYDNFNLNFFRLINGNNLLEFKGNGFVEIKCEFPVNVGA